MIASIFPWSARKLLLLLFGTGVAVAGIYALIQLPLDEIAYLADTQVVVVYTEGPGQAPPQVVEDRDVSAPTAVMLMVPKSKAVYGFSLFGVSFIYAGLEDGPASGTFRIDPESDLETPLKSSAEAGLSQAASSQLSANEMTDTGGRR